MNETLIKHAVDSLVSAVAVVNSDGTVQYVNDAWEALDVPGTIPAAVSTGNSYTEACEAADEEYGERARQGFTALVDGDRTTFRLEYPCPQPDALPRWFRLRARRFEAEGAVFVAVEHDEVTDQHQTKHGLEHRSETLADVASIISHDIRSPLTAARSWAEVVGADPAVDDEKVGRIIKALDRMNEIITDAVSLARETDIDRVETVTLDSLATEVWATLDQTEANITVEEIEPLLADESLVHSLLDNLFRNSLEHAGPGVSIRVGPVEDGFYVEDDGPGIDPAIREDIFEAGVTTRSTDENTGIGLALVERIVDAHEWHIELVETGRGARFEITDVLRPLGGET